MPLNNLIALLHKNACSLVLEDGRGSTRLFYKRGVRDLEYLLDHEPDALQGATLADKVIGKAAAGMMVFGGVKEVYADVLGRQAIPILEAGRVKYTYGRLVDHIVIPRGDTRCPLEQIVAHADTARDIVATLRAHFARMQQQAG